MEPREEAMRPHHEPEALLLDPEIDTGDDVPDSVRFLKAERIEDGGDVQKPKQAYKTMMLTENNLKTHQKQEVGIPLFYLTFP